MVSGFDLEPNARSQGSQRVKCAPVAKILTIEPLCVERRLREGTDRIKARLLAGDLLSGSALRRLLKRRLERLTDAFSDRPSRFFWRARVRQLTWGQM